MPWLTHGPFFYPLLSHESSGLPFISQTLPDSPVSQSTYSIMPPTRCILYLTFLDKYKFRSVILLSDADHYAIFSSLLISCYYISKSLSFYDKMVLNLDNKTITIIMN